MLEIPQPLKWLRIHYLDTLGAESHQPVHRTLRTECTWKSEDVVIHEVTHVINYGDTCD